MRRDYLYYVFFLILLFISALILWPSRWVNVDIGDFHYHKYWQRLTLTDVSNGAYENDFSLRWGKEFEGGMKYVLDVELAEGQGTQVLDTTVSMLRDRIITAGYEQGTVWYEKVGDAYQIFVTVNVLEEDSEVFERLLTQNGILQLWGGQATPDEVAEDVVPTDITAVLEPNYDRFGIENVTIKGFRIGEEEGIIFLTLGLTDDVTTIVTETVPTYYNQPIISVLDDSYLPIHGGDLGNQLSQRGIVRTLRIPAFETRQQARITGSIISHGPLDAELSIAERELLEPTVGLEFIRQGIVVGGIIISLLAVVSVILFRMNGLSAAISLVGTLTIFVVALKVLNLFMTLSVVIVTVLIAGWLVHTLAQLLYDAHKEKDNIIRSLRKSESAEYVAKQYSVSVIMLIIGVIGIIVLPLGSQAIGYVLVVGSTLHWISIELIVPIMASAFALVTKET